MTVQTNEKYCPICGKPVVDSTYNRFGEFCCSEAHAEEYVKEVRGQRILVAAGGQGRAGDEKAREERARRGRCC